MTETSLPKEFPQRQTTLLPRYSKPLLPSVLLTLALVVTSALFSSLSFAGPPKDFEAVYKAKYSGIRVTARRVLETLPNGNKKLTFTADSWVANLMESSEFRWSEDNRIIPLRYEYKRGGLGRDREAIVSFDWDKGRVTNDVQQKPWTMEVPEFALDKLSYQLQIQADLINGKPLLEYAIADGGRLKHYAFEILGEEVVDTPAGKFNAVKVKRVREETEERQTIFWLAKDWDYLVVRLQQKEDGGSSYEIDLNSATLDGKKVKGD